MKWLIFLIAIPFLTFTSCKCCKSHKSNQTEVAAVTAANTGTVSHQYRTTGCKTVIVVDGDERVTIIPVEGLPESMDVDGTKITFDYTTLRMPQPEGCNTGLPASLTNVTLKK